MSACLNIIVILGYTRRCFVCVEQIVFFFQSTLRYRYWQDSAQSNERERLLKGTNLPNFEIVLETLKLSLLFINVPYLATGCFVVSVPLVRPEMKIFVCQRCFCLHALAVQLSAVFHTISFLCFQQAQQIVQLHSQYT